MQKELVKKYLNGQCTYEEEQQIIKLLRSDKGLNILHQLADEFWEGELSDEEIDHQQLFDKIMARLPKRGRKKHIFIRQFMKYAATLLVLVVAYFTIKTYVFPKKEAIVAVQEQIITKSTTEGQKLTVMLPDGTKLILNALSSVSFPQNFTDSTRAVKLLGEAFFMVAKDPHRPFSVTAGGTTTTALGTSFNINSRSSAQQISLATGKVLIQTDRDDYILKPGEALQVDNKEGVVRKFVFDRRKILSWKDSILYFDETPFDEVVASLEMWYGVSIEVSHLQLNELKYTGQFDDASLEHVLQSMAFALDFDYTMKGKNVKINHKQP